MKLVKYENFLIKIEDELLLLTPFKTLHKKDKSKDKKDFMEFLTILYFVYDPRSDYSYIIDEKSRIEEVCESNGFEIFKPDDLLKSCIELYKKLTVTTSSDLLRSTRAAISAVQSVLDEAKSTLESLEDKDKLAALKNIVSTTALIPKLAKDVQDAEKAIARELEELGRARGGNNKSLMDDGILI